MYCTSCGMQLQETARFCSNCGQPVNAVPAAEYVIPKRRLHRIMEGKKIAGVCTGFAEYFDMDVTMMRIIWVAMALLPPSVGIMAYIVAWIAMPKS